MVSNIDFTNRLKKIMKYYNLTASLFADKIDVQRSSISHILSGRNKPSLDFVLKITNTFEDIDIYWLLNGKGTFPKVVKVNQPTTDATTLFSEEVVSSSLKSEKSIQRIVVFYSDGTFEEYKK
ncbi:MAG: helix-turn-helix transcriptional regulator [Flavobacteriaceae bacterium]|nr:helix-turn-helix transcriptional regulator [Flavobacteriaceae bacterium]